ncbi:hypothetical protein BDF19DRAFT_218182 [Syncephalis fuscata]|nr:hypothetical protein BDF19DRAFT_218182 [Syncephalis fuscata]
MSALMSDFLTIRPGTSLHTDDSTSGLTESVGGDSEHGGIDSNDPIYVPSAEDRDATGVVGSAPTLSAATNRVAPDLDSQDAFPALTASATSSGGSGGPAWGTGHPSAPSLNSVFSWGTSGPTKNKPEKVKGQQHGFPLESSAARANQLMEILELPAAQVKSSGRPIGEVIRELTRAANHGSLEIDASTGRRSGNVTFLIRGHPVDVANARRKLTVSFSPRGQLTLNIPNSTRRFIIGTGGQTLREIERVNSVKIQFPPRDTDTTAFETEEESTTVSITIEGDLDGVKAARERIEQIVSDRVLRKTISIDSIEPIYFRALTPARNERLQRLINETNTRVRIPYGGSSSGVNGTRTGFNDVTDTATITIIGKSPSVEAVEQEILNLYKTLKQQMRTIVVVIPKPLHRHIVGLRGTTLQEIEEKTDCYVEMPGSDENSEQVSLIGPEDKLVQAIEMITEKTATLRWSAVDLTAAVHSPSSHVLRVIRYLTHTRQLQQLETEQHVNITLQPVPAHQPVIVEINGDAASQIHTAKQQLIQLVKSVPVEYMRAEPFEPIWRRSILGNQGEHCRQILESLHVEVLLPKFTDPSMEVLLVYKPATKSTSPTQLAEATKALTAASNRVNALKQATVDFTSKNITIPLRYYRQLIESRDTLNELVNDECASVSVTLHQSTEENGVCITGAEDEVEQVVTKLHQLIKGFHRQEELNSYTTEVKIPTKFEAHIIGRKGANLNRLREQFSVKVDITEAAEGEHEFTVTIQGVKKQADSAAKELREIQERLADSVIQRMKIPVKLHPALIGPQGRYVRRLEENYQVRIKFPRSARGTNNNIDNDDDNDDEELSGKLNQAPDEVIISGGRKGVASARAEMQELIDYEVARGYVTKFEVAARHLPFIMGKRGVRINELRDETSTQIDIKDQIDDNASENDDEVQGKKGANGSTNTRRAIISIQGRKEDAERARRQIEAIINEQEDLCTLELSIPIEYHRQLIGTGGARIRELVKQCGGSEEAASMVRFPRPNTEEELVTIRGQRALAQKVHTALKALVDEQLSRHTLTITVPTADRSTIIGQQGKTMKALETDHK